jgi:hypothetical protein
MKSVKSLRELKSLKAFKAFAASLDVRAGARSSATSSVGTTAPPSVSAADGSDVAACSDANCEVSVRAGAAFSMPKSVEVEALKVTVVTTGRVTVTGHDIGSSTGAVGGPGTGGLDVMAGAAGFPRLRIRPAPDRRAEPSPPRCEFRAFRCGA